MNKYQKTLYELMSFNFESNDDSHFKASKEKDGTIEIKQCENYNVSKDYLIIQCKKNLISKIETLGDDRKHLVKSEEGIFKVLIDFEKPLGKIVIHFVNDLCDPLELMLKYIQADTKIYDAKMQKNIKIQQTKTVKLTIRKTDKLVNVFYAPLNESYSYSILELYTELRGVDVLMGQYKTEENIYFHAIGNLAYGGYKIKLIQYNAENEMIFISDYHSFRLEEPDYGGEMSL